MATTPRYSVPVPEFALDFLQVNGFNNSAVNTAIDRVGTQFAVTETTKEFSAAVERSALYIDLDVERLVAVETGAIDMEIAQDKTQYQIALAASVRDVKQQQALLEGDFGVDVAIVKSSMDLAETLGTTSISEGSYTAATLAERVSVATLVGEEEQVRGNITALEVQFRENLSDVDYRASNSLTDSRYTRARSRSALEVSGITRESAITNYGLSASYLTEKEGLDLSALNEVGYIQSSGLAEVTHINNMSVEKIDHIQASNLSEISGISQLSGQRVYSIEAERDALLKAQRAQTHDAVLNIGDIGGLESQLIIASGKAGDDAYIVGARADMAVDLGRYGAEAAGIRNLASVGLTYIAKTADAEATNRITIAGIEGQGAVNRAAVEGQNEVLVAGLRGGFTKSAATQRAAATAEIALARAQATAEMSRVVVKQIADDSLAEATHIANVSRIDVNRTTTTQMAEVAGGYADSAEAVRHMAAVNTLNNSYLSDTGVYSSQFIIDYAQVGIDAAISKVTEEARYVGLETAARTAKIITMGSTQVDYIGSEAQTQANYIKSEADKSDVSARALVDVEYTTAIDTATNLGNISTAFTDWATNARITVGAQVDSINAKTSNLLANSVVNYNTYTSATATGGPATSDAGNTLQLGYTSPEVFVVPE